MRYWWVVRVVGVGHRMDVPVCPEVFAEDRVVWFHYFTMLVVRKI
jgi:hypothetical protein